ncbi:MAG: ATP-dependent Clp protease adaptor ClpS [Salinivirgaceae bacterium]|nr:ATP-dependent Clp protease adaptor ClpS [Salinivirgaceae bacterium]
MNREQFDGQTDELTEKQDRLHLVLYNDDFNTFEHVIESLIDVCHHTPEQAEQCALIVHTKGRYEVKSGTYKRLLPMKNSLTDRELTVSIE